MPLYWGCALIASAIIGTCLVLRGSLTLNLVHFSHLSTEHFQASSSKVTLGDPLKIIADGLLSDHKCHFSLNAIIKRMEPPLRMEMRQLRHSPYINIAGRDVILLLTFMRVVRLNVARSTIHYCACLISLRQIMV